MARRRFLVMMVLAVLVCTASGCTSKGGSGTAQPSIVVYATHSEPMVYWDPAESCSNEVVALLNVYEPLIRYDPFRDEVEYVLATGYRVAPDGLSWEFDLRRDVKFHCGEPFTAAAVKHSIERNISRGKGASWILASIKGVTVLDDYKVRFDLKYPAPLDVVLSAAYATQIYCPKHGVSEEWFKQGNACGTGPYKIESWKPQQELVLTKFDSYWRGWTQGQFDKAVIKTVPEPNTRYQMIISGQADILMNQGFPIEMIQSLEKDPSVSVVSSPGFQNMIGLLNCVKPPLNDKRVRQAICYAVPYQDIINTVMGGEKFARQSRGPIPYGLWGHREDLFQYTTDLEKARQLLREAGRAGGFKLLLTYAAGDENERRVAELLKASLAKLNIDLEVRGMPWEAQWELAKSPRPQDRQDIFVFYWWADHANPQSFLSRMFCSFDEPNIVFNLCYYKHPEVDRLVDQAIKTAGTSRQKAAELYGKAQEILVEDAPAIFFFDQANVRIIRKNLRGYKDNPIYPNVVFFYDLRRE